MLPAARALVQHGVFAGAANVGVHTRRAQRAVVREPRAGGRIDTRVTRRWSIDRSRFAQNGLGGFPRGGSPSDAAGSIRRSDAIAPSGMGLGASRCLLRAPDGSNATGRGENGADVGATVLHRCANGTLAGQPPWDRATGAFPCGARLAGANDVAGRSCFDVHRRLNVNANGSGFPASSR